MKRFQLLLLLIGLNVKLIPSFAQDQRKISVAVMNFDTHGFEYDPETMGYIFRLEMEKTGIFSVTDKYEMLEIFKASGFEMKDCYSRSCLVRAGQLLKVDKVISGAVEKFGSKIIISSKIIHVQSGETEKTETLEFLLLPDELQRMIGISVKKLADLPIDQTVYNQLVNYDVPVSSPHTTLTLNGPRMGGSFTSGETGKRLRESKSSGGFEMYPMTFQFGYQHELRYLSAGDFQALVEMIGLVGGLETGHFIPSFTFLNGFRWGKKGWEFAFGPSFRFIRKAEGFYDFAGLLGHKGRWYLTEEWYEKKGSGDYGNYQPLPYKEITRMDSRGSLRLSTGLLIAAGRTFRSGYLNVPVNVYVSPRKDGWITGLSFGFNVNRRPAKTEPVK